MNPKQIIHESWNPIISELYLEPLKTLSEEILPNCSYQPSKESIFKAFTMPVQDVKVVILGQDPYPRPGDAIGYSFATKSDRRLPASLRIIDKEITNQIGLGLYNSTIPEWKTLDHWVKSGVLLLNTALTVETGNAGSHLKYWLQWTKNVITYLSHTQPCIWILWGKKAQNFIPYIKNKFIVDGYSRDTIVKIPGDEDYNYILKSAHPAAEAYSGGTAGFYGNNHFIFTNQILKKLRKPEINW